MSSRCFVKDTVPADAHSIRNSSFYLSTECADHYFTIINLRGEYCFVMTIDYYVQFCYFPRQNFPQKGSWIQMISGDWFKFFHPDNIFSTLRGLEPATPHFGATQRRDIPLYQRFPLDVKDVCCLPWVCLLLVKGNGGLMSFNLVDQFYYQHLLVESSFLRQ